MDAATLRWIIIAIGAIILVSIFLFGNPDRKRKPRASRRKLSAEADRVEPSLDDSSPPGQGELPIGQVTEPAPKPQPRSRPRKPAGPPPEKIVTLFLLARDNHLLNGAELLQAAVKTGMEFGEMDIFHRTMDGSDQPIFSLANAMKPGSFDRDAWNSFETNGVAMFMALPGPILALDAWDKMLATARRVAEIINADIHDANREPFTRQAEARIREELRSYDRDRARKALI